MQILIRLVSCFILIQSSSLHAEQFQAPVTNTEWNVSKSPLKCTLSQSIPHFGDAEFTQESGSDLKLIFNSHSYPAAPDHALFEIAEAPWQNSEDRDYLMSIATKSGQSRFVLSGVLAEQALTQMQEGRFPAIRYKSETSLKEISALFSTVHLTESLGPFQKCVMNLYPDTFEDVRKLTIHFALESSNLSSYTKKALKRMADYVKIDNSISRITIVGHTDNHGKKRLNGPLSEERAAAAKNFLIENGVPEKLITTSAVRDLKPKTTNKTQKGRSLNRRAEIELFR